VTLVLRSREHQIYAETIRIVEIVRFSTVKMELAFVPLVPDPASRALNALGLARGRPALMRFTRSVNTTVNGEAHRPVPELRIELLFVCYIGVR
jgi:hypothetical protein